MSEYKFTKFWFDGSEIKAYLFYHLDKEDKHTILEIGSYEGQSSIFFADNLLNHSDSSLTCVDPFMSLPTNDHGELLQDNQEERFDYNISVCKNSEKITVKKVISDEFFKENTKKFDFIYIDGSHESDQIIKDMINAFNVLEIGGIMWMDDYGFDNGRVKKVMNVFLEMYTDKCAVIHGGYQLAIRKHAD